MGGESVPVTQGGVAWRESVPVTQGGLHGGGGGESVPVTQGRLHGGRVCQ